jgi:hypothetical protein
MEPKFSSPELNGPAPERSPEQLPSLPTPEVSPEAPLPSPERAGQQTPERTGEQSAQAQAALAAQPGTVSLPTPVPVADDATSAVAVDDLPAVAGDDDLIEKEWVDKAKQIINETRDDPAAREKQVSRLQADYLKKRYGKQLGEATD